MTPQVYSGSVPEDVGGMPFPDGWEPDDDHDHGVSDEEFASVVFDEAFVRSAVVHEPTAVERLLAAAQARAEASEAEARRAHGTGARGEDEHYDDALFDGPYGRGAFGHASGQGDVVDAGLFDDPYAPGGHGRVRWHRPVAWLLALVMGIGMVALAFTAVYRGAAAGGDQQPIPAPASTGLEQSSEAAPSASADYSQPPVPAVPRTP
jgi:hypothetical protein